MFHLLLLLTVTAPASFAAEPVSCAATQRLVHIPSGDFADFATLDMAANSAFNRRATQTRIKIIDRKTAMIDLAEFSRNDADLRELLDSYEQLVIDEPYFLGHTFLNPGGKSIHRLPLPHLSPALLSKHVTNVPVVRYEWLLRKMLSTIDGNLYARFRGIPDTQDEFLRKFAGVTEADVAKMRSDSKAFELHSKVTSKPRAVLMFRGIGGHAARNQGIVGITFDTNDDNKNAESDPFRNPVKAKHDATEVIAELPNGMLAYALFDGKGRRQNEAPPQVATDDRIPAPFTKRLDGGAISCIRCHAQESGWRVVDHDLLDLDSLAADKTVEFDRLAGLVAERLDKPLARARDDYSDAVVFGSSHWGVNLDAEGIGNHLAGVWKRYNYELVNERRAILELQSVTAREFGEEATLDDILRGPFDAHWIRKVDPYLKALKERKSITRTSFEIIFPDLALQLKQEN